MSIDDVGDEITARIVRLLQEYSIASERFVDAVGGRNNMHRSDLHALNLIMRAERDGRPAISSALGRELGLTPAAMTALIDRLETSGHAVRVRGDKDRRRVHVTMTHKAAEDGWRIFGPLALRLGEVIGHYTPEEQRLLIDFLCRCIDTMQQLTIGEADQTV